MNTKRAKLSLLLIALLSLLGTTIAHATSYTFQSENDVTLRDSAGNSVPFVETVAFGSFSGSFTPSSFNTANWSANWLTGENSEGGVDGNAWAAGFTLNESSSIGAGAQLYLWVTYDNPTTNQLETLLMTNPEWISVVSSSTDFSSHDYAFDAGTSAIVGTLDVIGGLAHLASASPIPEPATYAALFGAGALGFVLRRRRKIG
ncbi:MAG: exosortase [Rariglobus sp.]|jgi:hypothetical protein|nr:exosortase [Rariglobus sp.]